MALSNWDILAIDEEGCPTNGVFVTPLGIRVEIYKNWLYVHDEKAWREHGSFINDVVMEFNYGKANYLDLRIVSKYDEYHNAVFVVAWTGWKSEGTLKAMYGIGAYGFDGDKYVGVTPACFKEFTSWVDSVCDEEYLDRPNFDNALRFNQGDAFFENAYGDEKTGTPIGEQEEPYLIQMFKQADIDEYKA